MKFHDFTIVGGSIRSQRLQDTTSLAPGAVSVCSKMLHELHRGRLVVRPEPQLDFGADVGLGLPDVLMNADVSDYVLDNMKAPNRFYCVYERGEKAPFQVNLVLPRLDDATLEEAAESDDERVKSDSRTIGTLLGLGLSFYPGSKADMESYERVWNARPCLATLVLPLTLNRQMVGIAADFSTCFAAAMFRENRW